jgi:hypothetical protein
MFIHLLYRRNPQVFSFREELTVTRTEAGLRIFSLGELHNVKPTETDIFIFAG